MILTALPSDEAVRCLFRCYWCWYMALDRWRWGSVKGGSDDLQVGELMPTCFYLGLCFYGSFPSSWFSSSCSPIDVMFRDGWRLGASLLGSGFGSRGRSPAPFCSFSLRPGSIIQVVPLPNHKRTTPKNPICLHSSPSSASLVHSICLASSPTHP